MNILRNSKEDKHNVINLIQDQEGYWHREGGQQEPDTIHKPLMINIGIAPIIHEDLDRDILTQHHILGHKEEGRGVVVLGLGDSKKELIDILQHIVEEEGHRGIVIVGDVGPSSIEKRNATLGDFAHMLIEETKQDIFLITNTLGKREDIDLKIEENKIYNQKQAKHYHKFHNQKPRGPQGQYAKRGRK